MKKAIYVIIAGVALFLSSCSPKFTRLEQYPGMYEAQPVTLVVMPPINNTSNVDAKELLYTSISYPLIEAGYYVISMKDDFRTIYGSNVKKVDFVF